MSRIRFAFLGVLILCGVSAIISTSASALEFYKCVNVGVNKGKFENNQCGKEGGSKEWELELLKEPLKIVGKQTKTFELEGKLAGITVETKCEKGKGTGSIHNGKVKKDLPTETTEEVLTGLGLGTIEAENCTVTKPAGQECKVHDPIVIRGVLQLSTVSGVTYVLLSPDPLVSSTIFFELTLEGCKTAALNGTFPIEGMAAGSVNNATSTISFKNEEPNQKLLFGGSRVRLVGEALIEMEGGGFINAH